MNFIINRPKLCFILQNLLSVIEYTLLNVIISELKVLCVIDESYGRSKFGQYDTKGTVFLIRLLWLVGMLGSRKPV